MSTLSRFPQAATALVVGASGGIGNALARALENHSRFSQVFRTSRHGRGARENGDATGGGSGDVLALDITDDDSIEKAAVDLREKCSKLDLVIVASGLLHDDSLGIAPEKRLQDLKRSALHRQFDVNAIGPLMLARALEPLLPREEHCVWATLSARVGSIGDNQLGGWYGYRASKAAQNMFTRGLSIELGRRHKGLACIALHPGTVATSLSSRFRRPDAPGVMSPETAADHLLQVIDGVDSESTGRFFAWDGQEIPW